MAKPAPYAGLVIRYDYLWESEEARGRVEGAKVRPCAVVIGLTDPERAIVCGIPNPTELEFAFLIFLLVIPMGYWMLRTLLAFVGL